MPLKSKLKGIVCVGVHAGVALFPDKMEVQLASNPAPAGYSPPIELIPPGFPGVVVLGM